MHDYTGCIHVHSTYSDGHVAVPAILDAAREAGLDFLVLTDHATLAAQEAGLEGWHDGVLLDVGAELEADDHHCIALGLHDLEGLLHCTRAEELFEAIGGQGGLAFVVHPRPVHKPLFHVRVPGWSDWHINSFHGMEIWPYLHDWIRDLHLWNFLSHYRRPDAWVTGPDPGVLARWDEVGRRRRVVGIGSLDNHAKRFPFRRWGPALLEVFPHRDAFRTVRTHVLSPDPFSGAAASDLLRLHALLAQGRCYVSYDFLADATGFRFGGDLDGKAVPMGDEIAAGTTVRFHIHCPQDADLRLLRDGVPLASAHGRDLSAEGSRAGVYRAEASLRGRPWIFSNPIYLRESVTP